MKPLAWALAAMCALFLAAVLAATNTIDLPGNWRASLGLASSGSPPDLPCRPGLYRASPASPPVPAGHWRREPDAPKAQIEGSATAIGPLVYVVGGSRPGNLHTVLAYDTRSRGWSSPTHLPVGLNHSQAVTHDGRLYLAGGYRDGETETSELWEYDPRRDRWRQLAPMPEARGAAAAAVIGDRLYVADGAPQTYFVDDPGEPLRTLAIYDFRSGEWSRGPDAPLAVHHVAGAALGGRLYLAGGRTDPEASSDAFLSYDPRSRSWERLPPLPAGPLSSIGAVAAGGRIVVFGGDDELGWRDGGGSVAASAWAYDPAAREWSRLPDLAVERHAFGAAASGGGVYAIAGSYCPGLKPTGPVGTHTVESLAMPAPPAG